MEHIDNLSRRIATCVPGASQPVAGTKVNVSAFVVDFARLCKNIKETSFSEADRMERCKRLADDSGIDIFYIKELTF